MSHTEHKIDPKIDPLYRYKYIIVSKSDRFGSSRLGRVNVIDWDDNYAESPELGDVPGSASVVINLKTGEIVHSRNLLKIIAAECILPINYIGFYAYIDNFAYLSSFPYRPDAYYRQKNT